MRRVQTMLLGVAAVMACAAFAVDQSVQSLRHASHPACGRIVDDASKHVHARPLARPAEGGACLRGRNPRRRGRHREPARRRCGARPDHRRRLSRPVRYGRRDRPAEPCSCQIAPRRPFGSGPTGSAIRAAPRHPRLPSASGVHWPCQAHGAGRAPTKRRSSAIWQGISVHQGAAPVKRRSSAIWHGIGADAASIATRASHPRGGGAWP